MFIESSSSSRLESKINRTTSRNGRAPYDSYAMNNEQQQQQQRLRSHEMSFRDDISPLREQQQMSSMRTNQDNLSNSSYSSPLPIGSYQQSSQAQQPMKANILTQQQQQRALLNQQQQQQQMANSQQRDERTINRSYLQIQPKNANTLPSHSLLTSSMYAQAPHEIIESSAGAANHSKRNRSVSRSLRSLFGRPNSLATSKHAMQMNHQGNKRRDKSYESTGNYDIHSGK